MIEFWNQWKSFRADGFDTDLAVVHEVNGWFDCAIGQCHCRFHSREEDGFRILITGHELQDHLFVDNFPAGVERDSYGIRI